MDVQDHGMRLPTPAIASRMQYKMLQCTAATVYSSAVFKNCARLMLPLRFLVFRITCLLPRASFSVCALCFFSYAFFCTASMLSRALSCFAYLFELRFVSHTFSCFIFSKRRFKCETLLLRHGIVTQSPVANPRIVVVLILA